MDGITDSVDVSLSRLWEMVKDREVREAWWTKVGPDRAPEQQCECRALR